MNPLTLIPARYRKYAYAGYALAVIAVGALAIAGVETGKATDVLAYIGAALGLTAASNVDTADAGEDEPAEGAGFVGPRRPFGEGH